MPRTKKAQAVEPVVEEQTDTGHNDTQLLVSKEDYLKARATIKQFREEKKNKPKRQCSEKQLEALSQGRMKNQRFKKQVKPSD